MSHYKPYPAYKDSGVEWLGRVPEHWSVTKVGRTFAEPPCYGVLVPDFEVDGVPMLRISDMEHASIDKSGLLTISHELSAQYSRTIVKQGDVVLSVVGTIGKAFEVGEQLAGCNLSRAVARVQPSDMASASYLCKIFDSSAFTRYVDVTCLGSAQRVLNMGDLSGLLFCIPTVEEQAAICIHLDRETARIDALIEKKTRFIALLREKRQALITHAVTKGLDPDVKMKDSGVEWLGEVPEHWDVKRLKFIAKVQTGVAKGKDNAEKDTVEVPYLRVANVQDGFLDLDEVATIEVSKVDLPRYLLQPGDVLMNEGGDFDKLGRGHVWYGEIEPCIHQNHVFAVRPHGVSSEWLNMFTSSTAAQFYFMGRSKQSTNLASISSSNLMELSVPLPSDSEQHIILEKLRGRTDQMSTLLAKTERSIELLKEHRSALITTAVTGQIDLRESA